MKLKYFVTLVQGQELPIYFFCELFENVDQIISAIIHEKWKEMSDHGPGQLSMKGYCKGWRFEVLTIKEPMPVQLTDYNDYDQNPERSPFNLDKAIDKVISEWDTFETQFFGPDPSERPMRYWPLYNPNQIIDQERVDEYRAYLDVMPIPTGDSVGERWGLYYIDNFPPKPQEDPHDYRKRQIENFILCTGTNAVQ